MSSSPYGPSAKILNEIWNTGTKQKRKGTGSVSLKSIVYSTNGELKCSKATYAICCHVIDQKWILTKVLQSELLRNPPIEAKNEGLVYILLYELLMGPNKKIRGGGALKRQIMSQVDTIQSIFQELKPKNDKENSKSSSLTTAITIPRYVRINTLIADPEKVVNTIREQCQKLSNNNSANTVYLDRHIPDLLVLNHTPEVRAMLQELVTAKQIILQDKSSCFSALCVVHGFENKDTNGTDDNKQYQYHYLDACAAPGNKTSHLAALVQSAAASSSSSSLSSSKNKEKNTSKHIIYALDKSSDRYQILQRRMNELVPSSQQNNNDLVQCHQLDFFDVSPSKKNSHTYDDEHDESISQHKNSKNSTTIPTKQIRAIMLDPSCSGSGMTTTNQNQNNDNTMSRDPYFVNDRIQTLSNFQFSALLHAGTDFPNVDRIVYSTCSLYVKENEDVVSRFLASFTSDTDTENNELEWEWELCAPKCLTHWQRRGLPVQQVSRSSIGLNDNDNNKNEVTVDETTTITTTDDSLSLSLTKEQTECLIRAHPDEDATNGFFVACFQRKAKGNAPTTKMKETMKKTTRVNKVGKNNNNNQNQTSSTSSSSSFSSSYKLPSEMKNIPKGMEFYDNQFDCKKGEEKEEEEEVEEIIETTIASKEKSNTTKKKKSSSPSSATNNKKTKSSGGGAGASSNKKDNKKRGSNKISGNGGDGNNNSNNNNGSNRSAKKRTKKSEWKQKQRLKREDRLKRNKNNTTPTTTNDMLLLDTTSVQKDLAEFCE